MSTRWRHISTLPEDFYDALLFWNNCNGPHYSSIIEEGGWWKIQQEGCWTMWRELNGPTDTEIAIASRIARRIGAPDGTMP